MVRKEGDFSEVSYVLGVMSIVLAFFQPLVGIVLGIIGLIHSKKQKTPLSTKSKKLNIIGIILSIILIIIAFILAKYYIPLYPSII